MTRLIKSIEPVASTSVAGDAYMRIDFYFENHPFESFTIKTPVWLKILADAREQARTVSWNDLKKEIYYAVVMEKHDLSTLNA